MQHPLSGGNVADASNNASPSSKLMDDIATSRSRYHRNSRAFCEDADGTTRQVEPFIQTDRLKQQVWKTVIRSAFALVVISSIATKRHGATNFPKPSVTES